MDQIQKLAQEFLIKCAKETQYLYHLKEDNFKGKYILPLSELKENYPDLYKKQIAKYKDREEHPEIKIKPLNCQWKDCVNLSSLNPEKIFLLADLLGLANKKYDVFKIKISDLDGEFCLYDDNKSPKNQEAYSKITANFYKETNVIPSKTVKYFAESKEKKEQPLLFAYIPHVLFKGKIDVSKAEVIKLK